MSKFKRKTWSPEEIETLYREFPRGSKYAFAALPNFSETAIRQRASAHGIKVSEEAKLALGGPNEAKIVEAMKECGPIRISDLAKRLSYSVGALNNALRRMRDAGRAETQGENYACKWVLTPEPPKWDTQPEFIKVRSIFRVGDRYAKSMEQSVNG